MLGSPTHFSSRFLRTVQFSVADSQAENWIRALTERVYFAKWFVEKNRLNERFLSESDITRCYGKWFLPFSCFKTGVDERGRSVFVIQVWSTDSLPPKNLIFFLLSLSHSITSVVVQHHIGRRASGILHICCAPARRYKTESTSLTQTTPMHLRGRGLQMK